MDKMLLPGHPETAQKLIGRRLRIWRTAKAMGVLEFARALDMDPSQLSRIEQGKSGISQNVALRAMAATGADLAYIYFGRRDSLSPMMLAAIARLENEGDASKR